MAQPRAEKAEILWGKSKRTKGSYLWVLETLPLRLTDIVIDTNTCIWKRHPTDKQDDQNNVWKGCSKVHNLCKENKNLTLGTSYSYVDY